MMNTVPPSKKIRVLVVDDSTFMRGALVRMIAKDSRFDVIDTAVNGKEGVEKAQALRPDVMTMDVEMPVMNGLDALGEIMKTVKTPVIMISTLTEAGAETTIKALELGAVDFVPKAFGDQDRNIFRGAEELYEKLLAAAGVNDGLMLEPRSPGLLAAAMPRSMTNFAPLPPKAVLGLRVNARLVLIGSSTGGPKALQTVIAQLPANLPVPVVIAQHMPPQFTNALARRLDETCNIKVKEVTDNEPLMPGTVYISPGGLHTRLSPTHCQVGPDKGESLYKPSVDVLAESVVASFGRNVVAVMLTGMGNDGMKEFVKLKELGAHVIAQDKDSCVVYGMPKAVVEAGAATEVLPLEEIGKRISSLLM